MATTAELAGTLKFALSAAREFSWPAPNSRAMNELAEKLGHELGCALTPGPLRQAAAEVSRIWQEDGLGEMRVDEGGRVLELEHCYDCEWSKHGLATLPCSFKGTLIGVALSYAVKEKVRLTETGCCRKGETACTFAVKAPGGPPKKR